jgi:hypothetical protein
MMGSRLVFLTKQASEDLFGSFLNEMASGHVAFDYGGHEAASLLQRHMWRKRYYLRILPPKQNWPKLPACATTRSRLNLASE